MAITPAKGYIVDPNNPNAVIKDTSSAMPGSVAAINQNQPSISYGAINSNLIAPTPQVNLPTPPTNNYNAGGILAGGNAEIKSFTTPSGVKVDAQGKTIAEAPKIESKSITGSMADIFQKYFPTQPKSNIEQYNQLTTQAGIDEKTTAVNEANQRLQALNAQLEGINSQAALLQASAGAGGAIENQLQVDSEGRGRTSGGLSPLRADEIRKNNIRLNSLAVQALPLQAQILTQQAVVTGNRAILESAQKKVDQTFEIYKQDAKDQYDYQVDVFNSISDIVSKEEAKILSEKKTALATNQSMVNDARNFAQQLSASIFKENPTLASQLAQIIPPDPSSATFTQDLQKYNDKVAQIQRQYTPKTSGGTTGVTSPSQTYKNDLDAIIGATLSTIPSKFGQETFNTQVSKARNDEDKINLVAAQVLKGQPAEFKNDFRNQAVGVSMIDKAIAEIDSGVKTGAINNAKQYTYNLVGKDFDPALARIQGYITSAIQPYRNSVTGAAWGEQEEAEYQSLFGSTKYSPAELKQRLLQTKELLKSKSAEGLNAFVNPLGTYDNAFQTGSLSPANQTITPLSTDTPQTKTFMQSVNEFLWGSN